MTEIIKKSLRDSTKARWIALILASFSIFGAYYFNYALSSIKPMLESILGWNSEDFGTYTSAYAWFNVFLFMLIISGFILDKLGIRKTGLGATIIMFVGTAINFWAVKHQFADGAVVHIPLLGDMKTQVFWSSLGFAIFGVGTEAIGITISKAVVRWFKGKEMALAMGMQMSIARMGTVLALATSLPLAKNFTVTAPIFFALVVMIMGVISFAFFSFLDVKLDKSEEDKEKEKVVNADDEFKIKDILFIIGNLGFWYIAILCVLFYSAVFPFLFYANDLMVNKYNVSPYLAGLIPGLLPFGTLFLTPLFGGIYDKYGKGATIMIIGSLILILVHGVLAIPTLTLWWVAAVMVIILGIGFSLVPSAMWPSVPKIIPEKQLGTAYAVIFWIQNIGLLFVPLILGFVLNSTNPDVSPNKQIVKSAIENAFTDNLSGKSFTAKEIKLAVEKATGAAVDSIVEHASYQPISIDEVDTKHVESVLYESVLQGINEVDFSGNREAALDALIVAGQNNAFKVIKEEKLNIKYDYFYDMLIFLGLSVLSLLFAFLLKAEDKKKGYGLELPNIEK
ncbi:MAG: MFS transporter [Bacteroidales bacterium]|jgi:MFS family permease|nr:MFS transporter [Bacteroidales bacterium]